MNLKIILRLGHFVIFLENKFGASSYLRRLFITKKSKLPYSWLIVVLLISVFDPVPNICPFLRNNHRYQLKLFFLYPNERKKKEIWEKNEEKTMNQFELIQFSFLSLLIQSPSDMSPIFFSTFSLFPFLCHPVIDFTDLRPRRRHFE